MASRSVVPCVFCAIAGLGLGWLAASHSTPRATAGQGDRSGDSVVATGPVSAMIDPRTKATVTYDALYYLDYASGRLMATAPVHRQMVGGNRIIGAFAVRDLVADFRPPRGATPRFLMTVGNLGLGGADGWAPLFVFETTTGQVATYRVSPVPSSPTVDQPPRFELIELKPLP